MKSPFPWFGGKSRAADLIWSRLGDVPNYVEPFFGSGAILLNRPNYDPYRHTETVNDLDCYLANFWRATSIAPQEVARWADFPVSECDLHARHRWLVGQQEFRDRMLSNPEYYDAKIAGWWVWGLCCWIGSGWCEGSSTPQKLPHIGDNGRGIHRKGDAQDGEWLSHSENLYRYFDELADRLRRVRVCCGDWSRVLGESPTIKLGITGVVLDPPYDRSLRASVYAAETDVAKDVKEWAIANGDNPLLRIAICGYRDEFSAGMPDGWDCVAWKANGGYGNQGNGRGRSNADEEVIWFSPHCLKPRRVEQLSLLGATL